jgi:hypothetical protein
MTACHVVCSSSMGSIPACTARPLPGPLEEYGGLPVIGAGSGSCLGDDVSSLVQGSSS